MPRIRVSIGSHEVDLEGPEQFINEHKDLIVEVLDRLQGKSASANERSATTVDEPARTGNRIMELEFGEALFMLPNSASGTDKILLAGKFAQAISDNNTFDTREANQLLIDQGIKLANASQSLKNNLKAKRAFKFEGRYRVSRDGESHIETLIAHPTGEAS